METITRLWRLLVAFISRAGRQDATPLAASAVVTVEVSFLGTAARATVQGSIDYGLGPSPFYVTDPRPLNDATPVTEAFDYIVPNAHPTVALLTPSSPDVAVRVVARDPARGVDVVAQAQGAKRDA